MPTSSAPSLTQRVLFAFRTFLIAFAALFLMFLTFLKHILRYLGVTKWFLIKLGVVPGNDRFGFAATLGGALAVVRTSHWLKKSAGFSSSDTRKITHTVTGLIYMLTWPLYTASSTAPYLAAFTPAAMCVQVTVVGLGFLQDQEIVQGMTRHGRASELLGVPLSMGWSIQCGH
ncbi:hypothetical protein CEUSTIGMA_g4610.t1 [Chlamydomonas eustigma]|uniref:Uncharacterized protein n=1 Tax=Chlamydomonas eustigma TaxID=1157962 RepID=A0A250X286_9CHLO|nr:hypothetical protein CEUSTIGMA_g4610.t1 [Chlamydomonas eustigma]|eukprot:GAX77165.1 hypothetical protein CEUSTIGMA_g4610.t1 [Chlamydomonas eustigma]